MRAGTSVRQRMKMKVWREGRRESQGKARKRRTLETGRLEASARG